MASTVSLVKVGNSRALIIPSRILRRLNVGDNTKFEFSIEDDLTLKIKKSDTESLKFPDIRKEKLTKGELDSFMDSLVSFSAEEIREDERLASILSK